MDNSKHVLESFNEFLKYRGMELNEKEGSPLDLAGAKELVGLIMEYNAKLATNLYKNAEGLKGDYLREASKALTDGNYALAGVYSIVGNVVTKQITKESFEILKTLIPSITDKDYKDYEAPKSRKIKSAELLKSLSKIIEWVDLYCINLVLNDSSNHWIKTFFADNVAGNIRFQLRVDN
jgi:hypothetical protein